VRRHQADLVKRAQPVLALGVVVAAGVSIVQTGESHISGLVDKAYHQPTPSGTAASGGARESRSAEDFDREIRNATGRPPEATVVLNPPVNLAAAYPYWSFQSVIPQYSNPLAHYDARNAEITRWSTARTPAELLNDLDTSPFRPPTVFVFSVHADGWHSWIEVDHHLETPEHTGYDVVFSPTAFASPVFAQWTTGSTVVVVRR
jgi:galactan 5-O-arabinofuranosyltransferase